MSVIARTAFQIFKAEKPSASVGEFNSLAQEIVLPYKVRAAGEKLAVAADGAAVRTGGDGRSYETLAQAACDYLGTLASYLPIMARSGSAKQVEVEWQLLQEASSRLGLSDAALATAEAQAAKAAGSDVTAQKILAIADHFRATTRQLKKDRQGQVTPKPSGVPAPKSAVELSRAPSSGEARDPTPHGLDPPTTGAAPLVVPEHNARSDAPPLPQEEERTATVESSLEHGTPPTATALQDGSSHVARKRGRSSSSVREVAPESPGLADQAPGDKTTAVTAPQRIAGTQALRKGTGAVALKKADSLLVLTRLRALTSAEKKVVAIVNQMIRLLAHVYATKYNSLLQIFTVLEDNVKAAQLIVDSERRNYQPGAGDPPEAFHNISLQAVKDSIRKSTETFKCDEECRFELDEDLLHPIAYACVSVVNAIEGYEQTAFKEPTEAELLQKARARQEAKVKREEQRQRALDRIRLKEEALAKREETRRLLHARLGDADPTALVEDTQLPPAATPGYVCYSTLPLEVEVYEQALFVWAMIASVPKPLRLSQMPFHLFLTGLQENDQSDNEIIEEVSRAMLDVCLASLKISSPTAPRIATRGKDWFEAMIEFIRVTSGNKKQRLAPRKREEEEEGESASDNSESAISDGSDSESSSSISSLGDNGEDAAAGGTVCTPNDDEEQAADEEAATEAEAGGSTEGVRVANEESDLTDFQKLLGRTMETLTELGRYATWGNLEIRNRLNLLQYMVQEVLAAPNIVNEADAVQKIMDEAQVALDRKIKDIRDTAERDLKALQKDEAAFRRQAERASAVVAVGKRNKNSGTGRIEVLPTPPSESAGEVTGAGGEVHPAEGLTSDEFDAKRMKLVAKATKDLQEATCEFLRIQDGRDIGARIRPIGTDRYRRLYWRFPLDRHITVQSTSLTDMAFPQPPKPQLPARQPPAVLDDEDHEEEGGSVFRHSRLKRGARDSLTAEADVAGSAGEDAGAQQRIWGVVPPCYLKNLVDGLDPRGVREGALRRALESMIPYVEQMPGTHHEGRVTRSRAHTHGYANRLKFT